jgi:hypothetical protein
MTEISQLCERSRGWASLRADGELSELEAALLEAHLARCLPCRSFAVGAEAIAAALRAARLEAPAPLSLVLPERRPILRALQVGAATALVVSAGAVAALVGVDRHATAATAVKPVAIVAADESPDVLRALRRRLLLPPAPPVPRNKRPTGETV